MGTNYVGKMERETEMALCHMHLQLQQGTVQLLREW